MLRKPRWARSTWRVGVPLTAAALLIGSMGPARANSAASTGSARAVISKVSSVVAGATSLGAVDPSTPERALIALQHQNQGELLQFISQVSDPDSALYGHYLTPAQFTHRYAPSTATVAAVETFVRSYGLRVDEVPANRAYVYVTGTAGQMERAFSTEIDRYVFNGRPEQAPSRPLTVPATFSGVITAVEGLDSTAVMRPMSVGKTPPPAAYVNAPPMSGYWGQSLATQAPGAYGQKVLPNVVQGYTPAQLQGAYGVADAIARGIDGSGQTVAVIDAYSSPTLLADVDTWSHRRGLPFPKVTVNDNAAETDDPPAPAVPSDVPGLGGANLHDPSGWFGEETLDVEAVHAIAPGAAIVMQSSLTDLNLDFHRAQNQVVSSGAAQIISNSYGGSSDSTDSTADGYWQQAAAQGIGVYFSSGDAGDQTAGGTDPASRAVDSGGNSPYVTSVGGTTLEVGSHNNRIRETYWGTGTADLDKGAWGPTTFQSGGGGGTSQVYAEPDYQKPVVPSRFANYWKNNPNAQSDAVLPGRVTPDISMVGDPNSGFLLGLTQDFTAYSNPDGYQLPGDDDHYGEYRIGGTSLSSPLFAGVMALADQAAGKPHGFVNPALYRLYRTDAFHDVTAPPSTVAVVRTNYVNSTNADDGTQTILRTAGLLGTLSSIPGYDDSTGLGTPNGPSLLAKLAPGRPHR